MQPVPFHRGNWQLRTLLLDGAIWFVAADVTGALGFGNGRQALTTHVDDIDRDVHPVDTPGGVQNLTVINEAGLYSLALGSRLPAARDFKRWVTGEVLPELRRTGTYTVPTASAPVTMPSHAEALRGWADAIDRATVAEAQVAALEPAARFGEALSEAAGDYSVREAAQILNRDPNVSMGERRLFAVLRSMSWIDRTNQPYQGQVDQRRLVRRIGHYRDGSTGELITYSQVRVTPKGLQYLHDQLGATSVLVLTGAPS
jgi:anti-repressor protein